MPPCYPASRAVHSHSFSGRTVSNRTDVRRHPLAAAPFLKKRTSEDIRWWTLHHLCCYPGAPRPPCPPYADRAPRPPVPRGSGAAAAAARPRGARRPVEPAALVRACSTWKNTVSSSRGLWTVDVNPGAMAAQAQRLLRRCCRGRPRW